MKGLEDPEDSEAMKGVCVCVVVMDVVFVDVEEVVFVVDQGRGELLSRDITLNHICCGDSIMS